jgi:hypothetical protein
MTKADSIVFPPGRIVATPGALAAISVSGDSALELLRRHLGGDWGEAEEHDRREIDASVQHGWRILSGFTLSNSRHRN